LDAAEGEAGDGWHCGKKCFDEGRKWKCGGSLSYLKDDDNYSYTALRRNWYVEMNQYQGRDNDTMPTQKVCKISVSKEKNEKLKEQRTYKHSQGCRAPDASIIF